MKKFLSLLLAMAMMLSNIPIMYAQEQSLPKPKHWASEFIQMAREQGVLQKSDEKSSEDFEFIPDESITRAQFVTFINRTFNFTSNQNVDALSFVDIQSHRAKAEIEIAYTMGYINGFSKSEFAPDSILTREQASVMIYRIFKKSNPNIVNDISNAISLENVFKDADQISDWARESISFLVKKEIVKGFPDGSFSPKAKLSMAQSLAILMPSKEVNHAIETQYKEMQAKKEKEEKQKKTERETKKNQISHFNSSNSSSDSGNSSNSDDSDHSYSPAPNQPNKNEYLYLQKISDELYIANINQKEELQRAKQEFFKKYSNIAKDRVYFGKIFKDDSKMLVLLKGIKYDAPQLSKQEIDKILVQDGLYVSDHENMLNILDENTQNPQIAQISLAVGKISRAKSYEVGEYFIGFPNNSIDFGITIGANTKMVKSLNFHLENTPKEALNRNAVLSQRGRNNADNPEDLNIVGNVFFFGKSQVEKMNGINLSIPVKTGKLYIDNNQFIGSGEKNIDARSAHGAAITLNSRALPNTSVIISNNTIKDYPYNGIDVTVGEGTNTKIENNELTNIGQNGIIISVFQGEKSLSILGNKINSYGTRMIKSGSFGSTPKESNKDETGISLQYIYDVYGVQVNGRYYNDKNKLMEDLQSYDNKVLSNEENDKIEGVFKSTPVEIGQRGRFHNPIEVLNSSQRIARNSDFIIVKSEDGDITLGQDPKDPNRKRVVKNMLLIGTGSGRVTLSPTLEITGDLIVDLPNATLKNQATVNGKINIINSRGNDNSSFSIAFNKTKIYKYSSTENEVIATISNIINQDGEKISAQNSILNENIKVFNGSVELDKSVFQINDQEDKITFSHEYLNKLKENTNLSIEYKDEVNKVNSVKKFVEIELLDNSSAMIDFTPDSAQEIIQAFAPEDGIKVQISQIKNVLGQTITKEDSNLSNLEIIYIYDNKASSDDFEIDDSNDTIIIKKSILNKLPKPLFGDKHEIKLVFSDEEHKVSKVKLNIGIKVINRSEGSGEIKTIGVMTFTHGRAPKQGISFQILGLKDARGQELSPSQTSLADYLTIIPFPVNWQFEIEGSGENIGFKKEFYEIDDDRDIITFKQDYLNHLNPQSSFLTNKGIKQFQLKYHDPRYATLFVSNKALIHIKSKLKDLSNSTEISSSKYKIEDNNISSIEGAINENTRVLEFIQNIETSDVRQTLRIYEHQFNKNGKVDASDVYSYKNDYEHLKSGDFLLVTAEDGKTSKIYNIIMNADASTSLIENVKTDIISKVDKSYLSLARANIKVKELLDALTTVENAKKSIILGDVNELIQVTPDLEDEVSSSMKLIIQKDEKKEIYEIKVFTKIEYRAIIIANSDYPGTKADLIGPVNDVKLMKRTFGAQRFDGRAFKSIKTVLNAKKEEFLSAISEAFQEADDNDISYLYYSGHGNNIDGMSYICTVDEIKNPQEAPNYWVSVNELKATLDKIKGKKVLILDSCNSGGFIGKPAVDAITGPTPKITTNSRTTEFLDDIINEFTDIDNLNVSSKPDYLVGNNYKVLAASSENEFSYEDKLNKVGKFTKALSEGAGIEGKLLADIDQNNEVSLEEMYQYTEDNVIYTSHVQAYPRNDSFRIFADPNVIPPSNNLTINAKNDAYKIIDNGTSFMVSSKNVQITTNMSVEDFLANIEKGNDAQNLYVIPQGHELKSDHAKQNTEKMARLDKLLVIAEDGSTKSFIITVKVPKKPSDKVDIYSIYQGVVKLLEINTSSDPKTITGTDANPLNKNTKIRDLKTFIRKGHTKQEIYVIAKDLELNKQNAKKEEETLTQGDRLLIYAESQKTDFYNIILNKDADNPQIPNNPQPNEEDNLSISSVNGKYGPKLQIINSSTVKRISGTYNNSLESSTKVSAFLEMIVKGNEDQELYVISKDKALDKQYAKQMDSTLSVGDRLLVYSKSQKTDFYEITVKISQEDAIDFGDAFEIKKSAFVYDIISKNERINDQMTVAVFLSHIKNQNDIESIFVNASNYTKKTPSQYLRRGDSLLVKFRGSAIPFKYNIVVERFQPNNQSGQTNQNDQIDSNTKTNENDQANTTTPPNQSQKKDDKDNIQVPPITIIPPKNSEEKDGENQENSSSESKEQKDFKKGEDSIPSIEITEP